jgi:CMP-N,N'-diacetyllegionaminic acid synthase
MTRLCTICARGGSKGFSNKNLQPLLGRPLVAHSVQHALDSGLFEGVAISSDSREIREAALAAGATWAIERPAPLATDESDKSPAIHHCGIEVERRTGLRFDTFVDLDATAPLRLPKHIREAVALVEQQRAPNVFSVCPSRRSPYFNMVETSADGSVRLCKTIEPPPLRRQDTPATFDMNASIYVWDRATFLGSQAGVLVDGTQMYVMPDHTVFDMDSRFDFELIEFIYPRLRELEDAPG